MGQEDDPALVDPVTLPKQGHPSSERSILKTRKKSLINCSTVVLQYLVHYGMWVALDSEPERQSTRFTYRAGTG